MGLLRIVPVCVIACAAACSQSMESGQGASGAPDTVSGSTGAAASSITSAELENLGTVPVIVFGAAFGLDRGAIEQAVADEMQASASGTARFVTSSQANVDPNGYSVVMLFNAPVGSDPGAYCSGDPPVPMDGPAQRYGGAGDVEIAGAFCRKGEEVSQVWVGGDDVWSLDDPGFRKVVGQAASRLMAAGVVSGNSGGSGPTY